MAKTENKKIEMIDPSKKRGLSKDKLNKLLKKWQRKLLLEDWKISIEIVDFKRTDYRQSGDFKADFKNKKAIILLTWNPFLKNRDTLAKEEEETIVHELIHVLLWDLDAFMEKIVLKNCQKYKRNHEIYMGKLEKTVDKIIKIIS